MRKTVLVIGASGFVGTRICYEALERGFNTIGTFYTNNKIKLSACSYYKLDLSDPVQLLALFSEIKPNLVVLCAGSRDIGLCESDQESAYRIHTIGTQHVIEACGLSSSRLVYISTDAVFSGEKNIYTEEEIPQPLNHYGKVKLLAENLISQSDIDSLILRTSLLFGWSYQGQGLNTVEYVVRSLRQGLSVTLPEVLYNTPIYLGTAAKIIVRMGLSNLKGVYNLAGNKVISRFDLGMETARFFNLDQSLLVPTSITTGLRPANSCLCVNKIEEELGVNLEDYQKGLIHMIHEPEILPGLVNIHQATRILPVGIRY